MFSLFDVSGVEASDRLTLTYNGLTLNDLALLDDCYRIDSISSRMEFAAVSEKKQQADGSEIYEARKTLRVVTMAGEIVAPSRAKLWDKKATLARTFDPALVSRNNPSTDGFIALDGSIPTLDTATYPSGLIARRVYARAQSTPQPNERTSMGLSAEFVLHMVCRDPRAYLQAESTDTWESGANVVANTKADYPSFPTITLEATGAGSATFSLAKTGGNTLTLNLTTLVSGDTVVIDMEKQTITKEGISAMNLYASGGWFDLSAGSNTITVTNPTNLTVTAAWRPAFCL